MKELELKFDPNTIEHLGLKMYSQIPSAIAELVANSYDADATEVHIKISDLNGEKFVEIEDNGLGMSFNEINSDFLIIGRKKRKHSDNLTAMGRKVTGRKGLGKLALFGIGKTIEITTKKENEAGVRFILDWDKLKNSEISYKPYFEMIDKKTLKNGTIIKVSNIKRKTDFNIDTIKFHLSRLFNFYGTNFKIFISYNGGDEREITREDRLSGLKHQFSWNVAQLIEEIAPDYVYKECLTGEIVTLEKPLKPEMRGITLYARGRQANEASFFEYSEAGYAFSYMTGWIDADFLDEQDEDVISTSRQKVDWKSNDVMIDLQKALHLIIKRIVKEWGEKRREAKKKDLKENSDINVDGWVEKVPSVIKPKLEKLIFNITDQSQIEKEMVDSLLKDVQDLIPEYTFYHYRMLDNEVKKTAEIYYKNANYYTAVIETMKKYKNKVKAKSGCVASNDSDIMAQSYGSDKPLNTISCHKRKDNTEFTKQTIENIVNGTKFLSMGVAQAFRNVISHEEIEDLQIGLFTEMDCLDALSLLSHLFRRLADIENGNNN